MLSCLKIGRTLRPSLLWGHRDIVTKNFHFPTKSRWSPRQPNKKSSVHFPKSLSKKLLWNHQVDYNSSFNTHLGAAPFTATPLPARALHHRIQWSLDPRIHPQPPRLAEGEFFQKIGGKPPKWMVKIMENPIKIRMIWGYHYFWKHPWSIFMANRPFGRGTTLLSGLTNHGY